MSDWNERLAEAITAVGTEGFACALDRATEALFGYKICMIFAYEGNATPQSLYHNLPPETAQIVIWDYCTGPYLLDPFYAQTEAGRCSGMVGLRQMAPDKFFQSEYYAKHYSRTGIRDEIGIFAEIGPRRVAVISFARERGQPVFSARERERLAVVGPVIEALMRAHWGGAAARGALANPLAPALPPLQILLDRIAGGVLTPRETEVIAMVLRGYSTAAIGAHLSISDETVKVHRKNAYRKLSISSQAQLFSLFLSALEPS
ncbi:helix-turn-helix transcriptional regulator [uncultured Thioclava sp.]|jgi:DNA-binding CsgD family transcriptional regulator|uniref:helix-turn-helix transcriptional regulator n=1 Tax=uncultured Thioclava sp. TaxID=473858 RepID=UPI0025F597F5|nr:helix-turn-helix transcriptional regulator [uncultured Thioclava sp.]